MSTDIEAPAVVAVVVSHDPGPYFEELLQSLAEQDYPNLSVLVVDAGSAIDMKARVATVLPNAFVRQLTKNPGYSIAANEALNAVEGAGLLLFCHDDVALDPSAVRFMVEEAFRSNAGIVAPKIVEWDDPEKLITVGASADKVGMVLRTVEPGEIDQGQHDAVRDVFVAPGGCMLVRADLFKALGGFDPHMKFTFEDADFSWRAQIAGARIVSMPAAKVRHALQGSRAQRTVAAIGRRPRSRMFQDRLREVRAENSLRCVLKNYSVWHLMRVVPQMIILGLAESIYGVFTGRPVLATSFFKAWWENLKDIKTLARARKQVQSTRQIGDKAIRSLQVSVRQRIATYWRSQFAYENQGKDAARKTGVSGALRENPRLALTFWIALFILTFFGMRQILFDTLPEVGLLRSYPMSARSLLSWWSAPGKIGELAIGSVPSNSASGVLGAFGLFLPHAHIWFMRLGVMLVLFLGVAGMYRTLRVAGSYGQIIGTAMYAIAPAFYVALSRGSLSGLVAYVALPYVFRYIAMAFAIEPFAESWHRGLLLRTSVTLALAIMFATDLAMIALFMVAAGIVFVCVTNPKALLPSLRRIAAVALVTAVLSVPTLFGLALQPSWANWLPIKSSAVLDWDGLLRLELFPIMTGTLGWAFLIAASLVLLIGREWRLRMAAFYWWIALIVTAVIWVGSREQLIGLKIDPTLAIVALAVMVSVSVGLGVAAFFTDLPQYRFGLRQLATMVAGIAVVVCVLPYAGNLFTGRYQLPSPDSTSLAQPNFADLGWMNDQAKRGEFRVLWTGASDLLPVRSWSAGRNTFVGLSRNGLPSVETGFTNPPSNEGKSVVDAVRLTMSGSSADLADRLSTLGVRYVVVPYGLPGSDDRAVADQVITGMNQQRAFRTSALSAAAQVFENTRWANGTPLNSTSTPLWFYLVWILQFVVWFGVLYVMRLLTPDQAGQFS